LRQRGQNHSFTMPADQGAIDAVPATIPGAVPTGVPSGLSAVANQGRRKRIPITVSELVGAGCQPAPQDVSGRRTLDLGIEGCGSAMLVGVAPSVSAACAKPRPHGPFRRYSTE